MAGFMREATNEIIHSRALVVVLWFIVGLCSVEVFRSFVVIVEVRIARQEAAVAAKESKEAHAEAAKAHEAAAKAHEAAAKAHEASAKAADHAEKLLELIKEIRVRP
jgi:hypothetical protein